MAILENKGKTISIYLQLYDRRNNIFLNELEYSCNLFINANFLYLSAKQHELCYISQSQINYIKKYLDNFNYDLFDNEEEIFSFYPMTMFLVIDFFKQNNNSVYVNLKSPIEIFDSNTQGEYKIGFDFEISLLNFIDFLKQLVEEAN